jgi:hypothetical protein
LSCIKMLKNIDNLFEVSFTITLRKKKLYE